MAQQVLDRLEGVVEDVLDAQAEEGHVSSNLEKQLISVFSDLQKEAQEAKRIEDAVKFAMRIAKITLELPNLKISEDNLTHFEDLINRNQERARQFYPGFENFFDNYRRVREALQVAQVAVNPVPPAQPQPLQDRWARAIRGNPGAVFAVDVAQQVEANAQAMVEEEAPELQPFPGQLRGTQIYWPRYGWLETGRIKDSRTQENIELADIVHHAVNNMLFNIGWML